MEPSLVVIALGSYHSRSPVALRSGGSAKRASPGSGHESVAVVRAKLTSNEDLRLPSRGRHPRRGRAYVR